MTIGKNMGKIKRIEGVVSECLPSAQFLVLGENGKTIRAYLCGKMMINKIRIIVGDKVSVEIPFHSEIGRIVFRKMR